MNIEQSRLNMIEQQIRPWDVLDPNILELLSTVQREKYVPEQYRDLAFTDMRIPISATQTMMEPKLEARLLQALDIQPAHQVLEIGTGTGYLTACLSCLAEHVTSYEIDPELSKLAGLNLAGDDRENISLRIEDCMSDWHLDKPFDIIAVTASLPHMNPVFQEVLKIGGKMFIVIGESPVMQALLVTRILKDQWGTESLFETDLAPFVNCPTPSHFTL